MPNAPLLSAEEIRHRLSLIRASSRHERNRGRLIGINTIAQRADLSRTFLYTIVYGTRPMSKVSQAKLSKALAGVTLPGID